MVSDSLRLEFPAASPPKWFQVAWASLLSSIEVLNDDEGISKDQIKGIFLSALKSALAEALDSSFQDNSENVDSSLEYLEQNPQVVVLRKSAPTFPSDVQVKIVVGHSASDPVNIRCTSAESSRAVRQPVAPDPTKQCASSSDRAVSVTRKAISEKNLKLNELSSRGECSVTLQNNSQKDEMFSVELASLEQALSPPMREEEVGSSLSNLDRVYKCTYKKCCATFNTRDARFFHQINTHMSYRASSTDKRIFPKKKFPCTCPVRPCVSMVSFASAVSHISEKHRGIDGAQWLRMVSYFCKVEGCDAYFRLESHLARHCRDVHSAGPTLECSQCSKMFYTRRRLIDHVQTRHERKFQSMCEWCSRTFPTKGDLKWHIRLKHTGELPSACDLCDKRFVNPSQMRNHKKRVHTLERAFVCELCGNSYKREASLKNHVRRHSDARPFLCSLCPQAFKARSDLNSHQRRHSEERPHSCYLCGRRFKERYGLKYHEQKNHGIEHGLKLFQPPLIYPIPVITDDEFDGHFLNGKRETEPEIDFSS